MCQIQAATCVHQSGNCHICTMSKLITAITVACTYAVSYTHLDVYKRQIQYTTREAQIHVTTMHHSGYIWTESSLGSNEISQTNNTLITSCERKNTVELLL